MYEKFTHELCCKQFWLKPQNSCIQITGIPRDRFWRFKAMIKGQLPSFVKVIHIIVSKRMWNGLWNNKLEPWQQPRKPPCWFDKAITARIQKVLSEGVQLWLFWGGRGSKHHYKRSIIGPSAKCHLVRWRADDGPALNAGLVAFWYFRRSGPVLDTTLYVRDFSGVGGGGDWTPCLPSGNREWQSEMLFVLSVSCSNT